MDRLRPSSGGAGALPNHENGDAKMLQLNIATDTAIPVEASESPDVLFDLG
jgi:hypothetical protein